MNTTYFLNLVAGNIYRTKTSPAIPSKYYIGLSTTTPTIAGGNITEPSASAGYARIELNSLGVPTNGVVKNSSDINWPQSTASWGTITHYVIWDSLTGGNALSYGPLTTPRAVEAATVMSVRTNSLSLFVQNASG